MRIGFAAPVSGPWATRDNLRRIAIRAEELGYHELWTFQRLLYPEGHRMGATYRRVHDPLVALAYLAGVTETIRLGVALVNIFEPPVLVAKQVATLQEVSGGRVTFGLGLGWLPEEFEAMGVDFAKRGRRGEEFVEVLRACWRDEVIRHEGEFYRVPAAHMDPKPSPVPPLLLGGGAEVALRRAGRLADGWVSASREDLAGIAEKIYVVKAAAREAGRDPEVLRFVCRGVTKVSDAVDGPPLSGPYEKIRQDVAALAEQGVTEVFHDLNFDPAIVTADPEEAMRRAEEALEALAP
ncbi:TIGR03619 family F420-dependent LLM class oxidoreductase [Nonomuraea africana]|uniref:F420-dependent oxidoreductase n=1 Tax=Nonomuraea africana TaxID=46171 RepID=A0ABR9KGJ6_9ACTN|nr:TIGR03619 family F420-dependent LLM class oxidoreductase [Nonomuraea africana]MBE1561140.1 putative F420-dependent oxidoreductase [Nonomuraea africana]